MSADAAALARLGALLASDSRAAIICALMGGTAHTNGELGRHLGLAPSSVSEHVGMLVDAGLVVVEAQGRHRYVRIADPATAALVEHLTTVSMGAPVSGPPPPRVPAALRHARSCYRHLAGRVGVAVFDALIASASLRWEGDGLLLGPHADAVFGPFDIDVHVLGTSAPTALARPCLDWSERRHHLAGPLGDAILTALLDHGWLRRTTTPRALLVTDTGRRGLPRLLRTKIP